MASKLFISAKEVAKEFLKEILENGSMEQAKIAEEWLPEAGTLGSAKSYRKRIFPLVKKLRI